MYTYTYTRFLKRFFKLRINAWSAFEVTQSRSCYVHRERERKRERGRKRETQIYIHIFVECVWHVFFLWHGEQVARNSSDSSLPIISMRPPQETKKNRSLSRQESSRELQVICFFFFIFFVSLDKKVVIPTRFLSRGPGNRAFIQPWYRLNRALIAP